MYLIFCALFFSLHAFAYTTVTTHDRSPEDVFTSDSMLVGTPSAATPSTYNEQWQSFLSSAHQSGGNAIFKLPIDWTTVGVLNREAAEAYNELLACAGGAAASASQMYLNLDQCPNARAEIRSLHKSLIAFTTSSTLTSLVTVGLQTNGLSVPEFHPLLVQMLFEQASAAYPFAYGDMQCLLWVCLVNTHKTISWEPLFSFYLPKDYDLKTKEKFTEALRQYINTGYVSTELKPIFASARMQRLIASYGAIRMLDLLTLAPSRCRQFGLWPKATADLLVAMQSAPVSQVEQYMGGERPFDNYAQELYTKMTNSCSNVTPMVNWWHYFVYREDPGMNYVWDLLAKAGAWRAMNERNDGL